MTPEIIEEWSVIDRWWTEEPVRKTFAEVSWGGRRIVMVLRDGDGVWRVHRR